MDYQKQLRTDTEKENREIRDKLALLKRIAANCIADKRLPNATEAKKGNELLDRIKKIESDRFERDNTSPLPGSAAKDSWWNESQEPPEKTVITPYRDSRPTSTNGPAEKRDYRSMFGLSDSLDTGGFKSGGEFLNILASGRYDERLQQRASFVEGIPSSGGFSVPEDLSAKWLDDSLEEEIVRPLCQVWEMKTSSRKVPGWDNTNQSGGSLFGGLKMEFLAETGTASKQTGKMRLIELVAKKGAVYCDISAELQADGLGFEAQLQSAMKKAISHGFDRMALQGSGAGQPLGVFKSPALISVSPESGQSAGTILYENLVKAYSRQLNKDRAVWVFNSDAIPQLMQISVAIGVGGSHVKLMNESNGQFSIFGRPCYFTSIMPTVGSEHDFGFIDFGAYALGIRKDISIDKSNSPGWTEDLISYRVIVRFDGQGLLSAPITPENGDTLSPFVSIDARA